MHKKDYEEAAELGVEVRDLLRGWILIVVSACSQTSAGLPDADGENEHYQVFIEEMIEQSLLWLGELPVPAAYCVAVGVDTPGFFEPSISEARAPSRNLLERLNSASEEVRYHSYIDCSLEEWAYSPEGVRSGMVWINSTEGFTLQELSGGWFGLKEATTWRCSVERVGHQVEVGRCDLMEET